MIKRRASVGAHVPASQCAARGSDECHPARREGGTSELLERKVRDGASQWVGVGLGLGVGVGVRARVPVRAARASRCVCTRSQICTYSLTYSPTRVLLTREEMDTYALPRGPGELDTHYDAQAP